MKRIAIFASGTGTNAEKIITHFKKNKIATVTDIVCNKPGAGVLEIAKKHNIPTVIIEKERFFRGDHYIPILQEKRIDIIVLAGFLWKVPQGLIEAYRGRIINIHPAILPAYGGKGMYGAAVHEAVIASGDKESGITIHYVDEQYDHGDIIFQARVTIETNETPETLAHKIHALEHQHFPVVIEKVVQQV